MADAVPDLFKLGADTADIEAKLEQMERSLGDVGQAAQRAGAKTQGGMQAIDRAATQSNAAMGALRTQAGALAAGLSGLGGLANRIAPQFGQLPQVLGQTITTTVGLTTAMGPAGAAIGLFGGAIALASQPLERFGTTLDTGVLSLAEFQRQMDSMSVAGFLSELQSADREVRLLAGRLGALETRAEAMSARAHATSAAQAQQARYGAGTFLGGAAMAAEAPARRPTDLDAASIARREAELIQAGRAEAMARGTAQAFDELRRAAHATAVAENAARAEQLQAAADLAAAREGGGGAGGRGAARREERVRSLVSDSDARLAGYRVGAGEAVDLDAYRARLKLEQDIIDAKREQIELTHKEADALDKAAKSTAEVSELNREGIELAAEATVGLAQALASGERGAIAEWLKGFAVQEALKALSATAEGVGYMFVPGGQAAAAGLFNAAALHGAAAAAAGGAGIAATPSTRGGGGAAAAAAPADRGESGGGQVTYVINYNSPMDEASLGRMQGRAQRAAQRRFG